MFHIWRVIKHLVLAFYLLYLFFICKALIVHFTLILFDGHAFCADCSPLEVIFVLIFRSCLFQHVIRTTNSKFLRKIWWIYHSTLSMESWAKQTLPLSLEGPRNKKKLFVLSKLVTCKFCNFFLPLYLVIPYRICTVP